MPLKPNEPILNEVRHARKFILFLTFLTGFSGLVFQVTWQKYFSFFLGGEALSSALVVSIFLGGLSLGYALFGKLARNKSTNELIKLAGWAEVGIGVWALLFPLLFSALWNNMGSLPTNQPLRGILDLFFTTILLLPATVLMGSTLPLLTRGLASEKSELSSVHSKLYGINTLGAFLGAILTGFYLIKTLGLPNTLIALSSFNLISGAAILFFGFKIKGEGVQEAESKTAAPVPLLILALSFLNGFVAIGFETVFMRSVGLAVGTSEYSYSLVVSVFVLMIAAGTLSLRWSQTNAKSRLFSNQIGLTIGLFAVFLSIPYWGWLNYVVRHSLSSVPSNFYVYHFVIFLLFSILISIPVFFMGRTMPLLFSALESTFSQAAQSVGRIYAANTIGCCLGGIVMGYLMFLYFDADMVFRFGIVLSAVSLGLILALTQKSWRHHQVLWGAALVAVLSGFVLPKWEHGTMTNGLFRTRNLIDMAFSDPNEFLRQLNVARKILYFRDDPNTNVAVVEMPNTSRSLYVNGKSDGSTGIADITTTMLLGHLPGLFTEAQGPAAVVGLGLGTSAAVISSHPHVTHVDVFEIAKAVIDAQPFFANVNADIGRNPKVTIHQMDAFRGLLSAKEKYSVLISEPSNPWVSGIDRLYTTEFYTAVKNKMLPGGVFAQWMHAYESSVDTFGMVMRTFSEVFPHVRVFANYTDLIIVGSLTPWNEERWRLGEARWKSQNLSQRLGPFGIASFDTLALYEVHYPVPVAFFHEVNSLFRPKLAYAAGRDFFVGGTFNLGEVSFANPAFALSRREKWPDSLVFRASKSPEYKELIQRKCSRPYPELSSNCKSELLRLAVTRELRPHLEQKKLQETSLLIEDLRKGLAAQSKLSPAEQRAALQVYPNDFKPPSLVYLTELTKGCVKESDSKGCRADMARQFLHFGYMNEAALMARADNSLTAQQLNEAGAVLQSARIPAGN